MTRHIDDVMQALDQSITAGSDLLDLIEELYPDKVNDPKWPHYDTFRQAKEDIEQIDDAYFGETSPDTILASLSLNDPSQGSEGSPGLEPVAPGALVSIPLLTETGPDVAAILQCQACDRKFQFFHAERAFFEGQGFGPPKRCKRCRAIKAHSKGGVNRDTERASYYPIRCAQCGGGAVVPFKPAAGRPVYCQDCNAARSRRTEAMLKPSASAEVVRPQSS